MHYIKQCNTNIHGQHADTQANAFIDCLTTKIDASAAKYRAAKKALWKLRGDGDWMHELRELKPDNIRGPGESTSGEIEEENDEVRAAGSRHRSKKAKEAARRGLGEGYKTISWIWTVSGVTNGDDDLTLNNALRMEWLKARAQVKRWGEEVLLLKEEMRRVLEFLRWKKILNEERVAEESSDVSAQEDFLEDWDDEDDD
ncbi:uncharacterized protein F5147DRAFT_656316 [Suillus discolor]|uniref:Uncharacterized protein n=1 Tax=Suillus discolor TaxID=1912936 RepID=A0A9P7EZL2_9AGAM|nr:uncharacterized protein F5147DRAFT_656316 [Suillus discolor]KAG2097506.1 hypothetical protein F5147DRAFT_656316 [Suillus discolor]